MLDSISQRLRFFFSKRSKQIQELNSSKMAPNRLKIKRKPLIVWLLLFAALCLLLLASHPSFQQQNDGGNLRQLAPMRILALFSGTSNDLGLDHRLARQVLKLAANRAKQLHPDLNELELIIQNDDTECTSINTIPSKVAEQFYSPSSSFTPSGKCSSPASQKAREQHGHTSENNTCNRPQVDQADLKELNLYLQDQEDDSDLSSTESKTNSAGIPSRRKVDAILGPSCDFLVDLIARMAAYWRTPVYSVASISGSFGRKDIYTTLTRLSPSIDHLGMFIMRTMEKFGWSHVAIIVDEKQIENSLLFENLQGTINRLRYQIPIISKKFPFDSDQEIRSSSNDDDSRTRLLAINQDDSTNIEIVQTSSKSSHDKQFCSSASRETLLGARKVARVFLLLINDQQVVRRLLLCASELYMNNGEFTFLALNLGLKSAKVKTITTTTTTTNYVANLGGQSQETTSSPTDTNGSYSERQQEAALPATSKLFGQRMTQNYDWYSAEDEANNLLARQMFESLMVFSVDLPIGDEYSVFVEQTLDLAHQEFPEAKFERADVSAVAAALHDSLLLAVEAYVRHNRLESQSQEETAFKANTSYKSSGQDDIADEPNHHRVPLMWNEHFSGGLINGMHINANGDQELDYVLSDLEPEMGLMRPVASYSKEARKIELIANTYIHWPKRMNSLTKQTLIDKDEPPPDEPECGFNDDAEECVDRQNLYAALAIVGIVVALVLASTSLSLYKYRQIKYQMQLDDYWWRINWQDLHFIQYSDSLVSGVASVARAVRSGGGSVISVGSDGASSFVSIVKVSNKAAKQQQQRASGNQVASADRSTDDKQRTSVTSAAIEPPRGTNKLAAVGKQRPAVPLIVTPNEAGAASRAGGDNISLHSQAPQSTFGGSNCIIRSEYSSVVRKSNLAMYKNELVIVKQLNSSSLEVSRDLLVELKLMRDHLNENLAKFIGLCVEPGHLSIVYEFCSRGSLQDMLLNHDVAMDWTLKYSIIGDILSGLNFIHTTLLDFHGRLKSTNLVLDSRFTVKITDFGLQNLYSQLEPIKDCDNDKLDDDNEYENGGDNNQEEDGDAAAARRRLEHDQMSLTVSQAAYNMESVSVVGSKRQNRVGQSIGGESLGGKMRLKNRGAVRYFWTAPEHLRDKNTHCVGSKKGDVYSFAIILCELFTRKEPYYYGTNAKPNWSTIKSERHAFQRLHKPDSVGDKRRSVGGTGARTTSRGSEIGSSISVTAGRQPHRSRPAQNNRQQLRLKANNSVGPAGRGMQREPSLGTSDIIEEVASIASSSVQDQESSQPGAKALEAAQATSDNVGGPKQSRRPDGQAAMAEGVELGGPQTGLGGGASLVAGGTGERHSTTTLALGQDADKAARLEAEEILDQLRMGVQPEPVRPYLPNYVLQDVNQKMLELMRSCWAESPAARPTLGQVRNSMRRITKGMASKNYLDNLLDRLQNYAADLERIVDGKSADILTEKFRTEELLFQLVPKFVADRLKRDEPIIPQVFDGVTIFFSDIVGFEKYSSVMSPGELVDLLNNIYSSFESIISSFDVTKIETIIDQFLVASGISFQQEESPIGRIEQQPGSGAPIKQQSIDQPGGGKPDRQEDPAAGGGGGKRYPKLSRKNKLLGSLRISHGSSDNKGSLDLPTPAEQAAGNPSSKAVTAVANGGDGPIADRNAFSSEATMMMGARSSRLEHYRRNSAEQIGRMALCIRDLVKSFHFRQNLSQSSTGHANPSGDDEKSSSQQETSGGQMRSLVATTFNIRIGIHSGKVCAGIVGVKRPKFCLIGDTVNVASRMHTNSKANRIQISGDTKQLLEHVPGFTIEPRGKIEVKGKGMMETFWLESSY